MIQSRAEPDPIAAAAGNREIPLIDVIRRATRPHHDLVEQRLIDGRAWTISRYVRLLRITHDVIAPVESPLCDRLGPVFAVPVPPSRVERLRSDLAGMGCAVPPPPGHAVRIESQADAVGVGYVLQGSLLGGAVITKLVRADCAPSAVPATYLEMYGRDLRRAWSAFCAAANAFGARADVRERVQSVEAAIRTFAAYGAALDSRS